MTEKREVVVVEHESSTQKQSQSRTSGNMKGCADQVADIAKIFGIDARLAQNSDKKEGSKTLYERAGARERKLREGRQRNLESIIKFAHDISNDQIASLPDTDWLHRFFDMAQDIYGVSMQKLWSQVLRQEITYPGSTSIKALQILKDMSPKEAQNLQKAASLTCSFGGDDSRKLLLGFKAESGLFRLSRKREKNIVNLGNFNFPYSSLLLLIEMGLVLSTEFESGEIEFDPVLMVQYQGKQMKLQPIQKGARLLYYRFSPIGNELCKLLGNNPDHDYFEQLTMLLGKRFIVEG